MMAWQDQAGSQRTFLVRNWGPRPRQQWTLFNENRLDLSMTLPHLLLFIACCVIVCMCVALWERDSWDTLLCTGLALPHLLRPFSWFSLACINIATLSCFAILLSVIPFSIFSFLFSLRLFPSVFCLILLTSSTIAPLLPSLKVFLPLLWHLVPETCLWDLAESAIASAAVGKTASEGT